MARLTSTSASSCALRWRRGADTSNDAVIALHDTYHGCEENKDGLCPLEKVVSALQKRMEEIDYDKACSEYSWQPPIRS